MDEIYEVFVTLIKPEHWEAYLDTPAPIFNGETARALIERGEGDRVLAALDQLASGAFT